MNQQEKECFLRIRHLTQAFENSPPHTVKQVSVVMDILQCLYDYFDIWTERDNFVKRGFPEMAFEKIRHFREYDYMIVPDISDDVVLTIHELCDKLLVADDDIVG